MKKIERWNLTDFYRKMINYLDDYDNYNGDIIFSEETLNVYQDYFICSKQEIEALKKRVMKNEKFINITAEELPFFNEKGIIKEDARLYLVKTYY